LDPPEHKAPSRREVMWIGGSLAEDRKHAEFSIVEYPRDIGAEDRGGTTDRCPDDGDSIRIHEIAIRKIVWTWYGREHASMLARR